MNEPEDIDREVTRLRPDLLPDQAVVARHSAQLRAAIAAAPGDDRGERAAQMGPGLAAEPEAGPPPVTVPLSWQLARRDAADGGTRRPGRDRRPLVAAGAATLVLVAGAVAAVVATGGSSDTTVGPAVAPPTATGPPVTDAPAPADGLPSAAPCGTELPIELPVLDGFEGPLPGLATPDPMAPAPANGSYAVHYEGARGTVDVRWPGGGNTYGFVPVDDGLPVWDWEMEPWPLDSGGYAFGVAIDSPRLGTGACASLDVVAAAGDGDTAEALYEDVQRLLLGPNGPFSVPRDALITGTSEAAELPPAPRCPTSAEGAAPDQGGAVDRPNAYGNPREALENFLATDSYLSHTGYEEITLADGSYAYRHEAAAETVDDNVHAVVQVEAEDGGWRVTSFEAYACAVDIGGTG